MSSAKYPPKIIQWTHTLPSHCSFLYWTNCKPEKCLCSLCMSSDAYLSKTEGPPHTRPLENNTVAYTSNQTDLQKSQINKIIYNSDGSRAWSNARMRIQYILSIKSKIFCFRVRVSPYNPFPLLPVIIEAVEAESGTQTQVCCILRLCTHSIYL